MKIKSLNHPTHTISNAQLVQAERNFTELINELNNIDLPHTTIELINTMIDELNSSALSKKVMIKKQTQILNLLQKKHQLVPKDYYRNSWITTGMTAIGLPIGLAIGVSMKNMGLLAIGLPIGMGIGLIIGLYMDKKAFIEGKQLQIKFKNKI